MQKADEAIEETLRRADRLYKGSPKALTAMMKESDDLLSKRLHAIAEKNGGGDATFSEAAAQLSSKQVQLVSEYAQKRLEGMTHSSALMAIRRSVTSTTRLMKKLEEDFTGISRPLNLEQAANQNELIQGTNSSLLSRHQASAQRYGDALVRNFESVLQQGYITGMTNHEVISRIVEAGKLGGKNAASLWAENPSSFPEPTSFMKKKYWAERIVRTETAFAYNRAGYDTIQAGKAQDFPDMQKKILATFDNRTAPDSIAVHGQIREADENFVDGAGREYLHPPGRPNDRETVVPWRPAWAETPATAPTPPGEAAKAEIAATPRTDDLPPAKRRTLISGAIKAKKAEIQQQAQKAKNEAQTAPQGSKERKAARQAASVAAVTRAQKRSPARKVDPTLTSEQRLEESKRKTARAKARLEATKKRVAKKRKELEETREKAGPQAEKKRVQAIFTSVGKELSKLRLGQRSYVREGRLQLENLLTEKYGLQFAKHSSVINMMKKRRGILGQFSPQSKLIQITTPLRTKFNRTVKDAVAGKKFVSGDGVKTVLHELSHSALKANWGTYSVGGWAYEEPLTELLAHRMTRDLGMRSWEIRWKERDGRWRVDLEEGEQLSYIPQIEQRVNEVIRQGHARTPARAQLLLEKVSTRMRQGGDSSRSIKDAYEDALEAELKERKDR